MSETEPLSPLPRVETGIPGLDAVLDGGLVAGSTALVVGPLGSGKTTLGNQIAFHHARDGGSVLFITLFAESHERLLLRLAAFRFFDRALVGTRLHYLNLLDAIEEDGADGLLTAIRREIRARGATLLVVDGVSQIEEVSSPLDGRRLVNRLQVATGLVGCTTLLLGQVDVTDAPPGAAQADGFIALALAPVGSRDQRSLRVVKFRGIEHRLGRHDVSITGAGLEVHPRLESLVGHGRAAWQTSDRLSLGIPGLDTMLGGGFLQGTSTLLLGIPGSGKTITGLHFIVDGATKGERGMIATFHESADGLANTASIGRILPSAMDDGVVEVFWKAPLEFSPDAWAWELLERIERHRPSRLFIDGLSDIGLSLAPERMPWFLTALMNELRKQGITTMGTVEIDAYVGSELTFPIPSISSMVDNGIMLRHVEVRSRLRRLVSVLKARQSVTDPAIREFVIGPEGIEIGEPFQGSAALLTGTAVPEPAPSKAEPAPAKPGPAPGLSRRRARS